MGPGPFVIPPCITPDKATLPNSDPLKALIMQLVPSSNHLNLDQFSNCAATA